VADNKASLAAENLTGTFTINWPGGTLNPSNGTLSVTAQGGNQYAVSGTVTSGADTGSVLSLGYLTTTQKGTGTKLHPVVSQQFVNTAPLALARNIGWHRPDRSVGPAPCRALPACRAAVRSRSCGRPEAIAAHPPQDCRCRRGTRPHRSGLEGPVR
jgi:hypothetical protein